MAFLDSLTGGAYQRANRNNQYAIATGMNQGSTALMDTTADANGYLLNQGLGALATGYGNAQGQLNTGFATGRADTAAGYGSGRDALGDLYGQAAGALNSGYGNALNALGSGYGQARDDLLGQYGTARNDINTNYGQARSDLGNQYAETQNYLGQATRAYDPLINNMQGSLPAFANAIGANGAAGSAQAQADFREAPGYAYARDSALGAVQRSAAARGGLAGGNATSDILRTATGLADQGWQSYINNLQSGVGVYTTGVQGRAQGLTNQGNASQSYGNSLATLGMRQGDQLANISTGLGDQLAQNDRGLGTAQAGIYQNQGTALGNLYQNLGGTLNTSHIGEGTGLASLDSNFGLNSANLSTGLAGQQLGTYGQVGSNLTSLGRNEAGLIQNMTQLMTDSNNQKAKGETQASASLMGTLAGIINSPLTGKVTGKLFG